LSSQLGLLSEPEAGGTGSSGEEMITRLASAKAIGRGFAALRIYNQQTDNVMGEVKDEERNHRIDLEAYRVARDTRNFEIKLFWKRSNYFLVLSTATAAGFFSATRI
jgi:hypothetical protein